MLRQRYGPIAHISLQYLEVGTKLLHMWYSQTIDMRKMLEGSDRRQYSLWPMHVALGTQN
jgi:hypothetical protein